MAQTILIVDDDAHIREVISVALTQAGHIVVGAANGVEGLAAVTTHSPALVVLDVGMPEMDGLEMCREIRKTSELPVLFLTARDDEIDRIVGFEVGGDDYVTKPFSPRELVARVRAILKRAKPVVTVSEGIKVWGALEVDTVRHLCRFSGQAVTLTASEFTLLNCLMQRPESVLSRAQVVDAVYGQNIHVSDRTIDSHIRNLRKKLANAGCVDGVKTIHGVGLRMGDCVV